MYGRCKVADNDTPSCFDEESSAARISGGRVADTDSPSWFRRGVVDGYVSGERGWEDPLDWRHSARPPLGG